MLKIWILAMIATIVASQPFDDDSHHKLNDLAPVTKAWNAFGNFVKVIIIIIYSYFYIEYIYWKNFLRKRPQHFIDHYQLFKYLIRLKLPKNPFQNIWNSDSEQKMPMLNGEGPYRLYAGQNHFALSMLNSLRKTNTKNIFFSPHSAYKALLLAYMGSNGETMESLEKGMFLDWAQDKSNVMSAYKSESTARAGRFSDKSIQFNSVDKLYITKNAQLK